MFERFVSVFFYFVAALVGRMAISILLHSVATTGQCCLSYKAPLGNAAFRTRHVVLLPCFVNFPASKLACVDLGAI